MNLKKVLQAKLSFRYWKNWAQTNVVWLLESGIYTCQLSTQVYTNQSDRGEIFLNRFWYRTFVLNFFEKFKFCLCNCQFVCDTYQFCHANYQFFDVYEIFKTDDSLILIFLKKLKPMVFKFLVISKSDNCGTLAQTSPWRRSKY